MRGQRKLPLDLWIERGTWGQAEYADDASVNVLLKGSGVWQNSAAGQNATVKGEGMSSNTNKERPCKLLRATRRGVMDHSSHGTDKAPSAPDTRLEVCGSYRLRSVKSCGAIIACLRAEESKPITE